MNNLANVYFLWGSEHYLIDEQIKKIAQELKDGSGEEPEILRLEADELKPGQVMEAFDFSSLFNLSRILIIKRPAWLGKSRKKKAKTEEYHSVLESYLKQPAQGQVVIITGEELPSGSLGKLLGQMSKVMHFTRPDAPAMGDWLQSEFRKGGKEMPPELIKLLAKSGQDMYYLKNLVDKLCLMHPEQPITGKNIEEELSSGEEVRVFKLSDALMRRDLPAALDAYSQLLSQGGSEPFFLYIIVQQFAQLAKVKYCRDSGMNNRDIESSLGIKGWAVRSKSEQAGRFTWPEIRHLFNAFLDTDIRLKTTSQVPHLLMEELIITICQKK